MFAFIPRLWYRHNQSVELQLHVSHSRCVFASYFHVCGKIKCAYIEIKVICTCISIYSVWVCVCVCKHAYARVCADILCNNISDESGINCQRLAPLMLLFLPLWQLCWTVRSSTGDTKKILWQSSSLLSWRCNLAASGLANAMNPLSLLRYQLSASFSRDITILS